MHHLNIEALPLILYFGSVSLLSLMYGVLKFFEKYQHRRRNVQEQNNDFVDNEKKHTIERDRKRSCQKLQQQQSKRKSPFTKLFRNVFLKLRFTSNNHKNEYFPSEQEKRCGIAMRTGYQQQQQQQNVNPYVYISGHDRDSQNLAHGMYDTFSTYTKISNWSLPRLFVEFACTFN